MVLGELKAIGEEAASKSYTGLFFLGLATGWLIILAARGAHKYRKEAWYYDPDDEPRWPGDER
jgi:hypothetical protein